jgi:hypothetical protein
MEDETRVALPFAQPVLVPPIVKSDDVNPVTGSENVIVTVKLSDVETVVRAVTVSVGAVVSIVAVVNCSMLPRVTPSELVAFAL